nr:ribosomal protein S1, mitochondrial [Tanacetum cinerariifolium]
MDRLNIPLGSLVLTFLCGIHSRSALRITSSSGGNSSQNPTTSPTSLPLTLSRTSIKGVRAMYCSGKEEGLRHSLRRVLLLLMGGFAISYRHRHPSGLVTPTTEMETECFVVQKCRISSQSSFIRTFRQTNRAPFDLPKAEAKSVAGYNVEYTRDAILNSLLLAEANVPGEAKKRERLARALLKRPFTKNIEGGWVKQTPSLDEHGLSQVEPDCAAGCSDQKEISRAMPEEMFLVDAGLATARMSMQDEPKGVPINRATRFENKVGSLDLVASESLIKKQIFFRFFMDLVTGESLIKERAAARFNDLVGSCSGW